MVPRNRPCDLGQAPLRRHRRVRNGIEAARHANQGAAIHQSLHVLPWQPEPSQVWIGDKGQRGIERDEGEHLERGSHDRRSFSVRFPYGQDDYKRKLLI